MPTWCVSVDWAPGVERHRYACDEWSEFKSELDSLLRRAAGVITLDADESESVGDYMFFGVVGPVAGVKFNPERSSEQPIQWVVNPEGAHDEFVTLNIGGTGTKLPTRYCVPPSVVLPVAERYFKTRELLDTVAWEDEWVA